MALAGVLLIPIIEQGLDGQRHRETSAAIFQVYTPPLPKTRLIVDFFPRKAYTRWLPWLAKKFTLRVLAAR